MKLGNEPAFATSAKLSQDEDILQVGMSKRFYAACAAMQGILANDKLIKGVSDSAKKKNIDIEVGLTMFAYGIADELLDREYEE